MTHRSRPAPWLALLPFLTACGSLTLDQPRDGSIHVASQGVPLVARTSADILSHSVTANGQAVSPPVARTGPRELTGTLNVGLGSRKVEVSATIACSFCSGRTTRVEAERLVCVRPDTRYPGTFVSALGATSASGVLQAWGAVPGGGTIEPRVVSDSGGPLVSWDFIRLAGAFSDIGVIESVEHPCRCLASTQAGFGHPLELVTCNPADPYQRWQFLPLPGGSTPEARVQNVGRPLSDACITEGPPPERRLIQAACQDSPSQRWRFRDNASARVTAVPW